MFNTLLPVPLIRASCAHFRFRWQSESKGNVQLVQHVLINKCCRKLNVYGFIVSCQLYLSIDLSFNLSILIFTDLDAVSLSVCL